MLHTYDSFLELYKNYSTWYHGNRVRERESKKGLGRNDPNHATL